MEYSEFLCVIFNAFLYISLLFFYWRKRSYISIGLAVLLVWAISATGAIFYEPVNVFPHLAKITLWPYLYLFVCNFMMFIPILSFHEEKIRNIGVNEDRLWYVAIAIALLSLLPFAETLPYYIAIRGKTSIILESLADRYEDANNTYSFMSFIGGRMLLILHSVRMISIFLLFYMPLKYSDRKYFKIVYAGIILSVFMIVLEALAILARFQIVAYLFVCSYIYISISGLYDEKQRQKVNRIIMFFFLGAIVILFGQTFMRLESWNDNVNNTDHMSFWGYIGQYLCEGMGNFNANIVHSEARTYTDAITKTYADFLGIEIEKGVYNENRFFTNQFFTVVGEYWRTYGGGMTLFIFIFFPLLMYGFVKNIRYEIISFTSLLFFYMYCKIAFMGMFYHAYFVGKDELFVLPIMMFFLNHKSNVSRNRTI